MTKDELSTIIAMALGEVSALFMSQEIKGTEIIMPSEALSKITDETVEKIISKLPN